MFYFLLLACTGKPADDTASAEPFDGSFTLSDANNYHYTSALSAEATEVGLRADFHVDWSGLTTDLLGHAIDPAADVDYLWFVQFPAYTEDEVLDLLTQDVLLQEDIGAVVQYANDGATEADLSDFIFPPNAPIDPASDFVDGSGTWVLRATTSLTENRMFTFVRPTEGSSNHAVDLHASSAVLDFSADLSSLTAYAVEGSFDSYPVDWSGLTTHGSGQPIDLTRIDQLMLARYDGRTVAELEADFLDIELIASETFTGDVFGLTATDLTTLTSVADGSAFDGFDEGLWLLVLRCTGCTNPSPPFLTVIQAGG